MKQTTKELSNIASEINRLAINAELTDDTDRFSQLVLAADINLKALALSKLSMRILQAKDEFKNITPASQIADLDELKKDYEKNKTNLENFKTDVRQYDDKDDEPIKTETHKPVKVVNMLPFELKQFAPYGSDIRCTKPTKDRMYVRILAACRGKFVTIFQVFPGIKNPDRYELITLQKHGYLERYTQPEYVTRWSDKGGVLAARKVWFKTTPKGEELLRKVGV